MQIPLIQPQTEWVMPERYPDLDNYPEVAIDLETKDPNLMTYGSGWARKDGHVIGIAVAQKNSRERIVRLRTQHVQPCEGGGEKSIIQKKN